MASPGANCLRTGHSRLTEVACSLATVCHSGVYIEDDVLASTVLDLLFRYSTLP